MKTLLLLAGGALLGTLLSAARPEPAGPSCPPPAVSPEPAVKAANRAAAPGADAVRPLSPAGTLEPVAPTRRTLVPARPDANHPTPPKRSKLPLHERCRLWLT